MNLLFLILIGLYDFLLFKLISSILDTLLKKILVIVSHFIFVTIVGFLYFRFFEDPERIDTPAFIICMYMAIAPLFFLMAKQRSDKMMEFVKQEKIALDLKSKEQLLIIFFVVTALVQLLLLFSN